MHINFAAAKVERWSYGIRILNDSNALQYSSVYYTQYYCA